MGLDGDMVLMRRRALEWIGQGETPTFVSKTLGCSRSSIYNWMRAERTAVQSRSLPSPGDQAASSPDDENPESSGPGGAKSC